MFCARAISCSQSRARSPSRFRPINSSRTAEAPAMTRRHLVQRPAADGPAQPSDGRADRAFSRHAGGGTRRRAKYAGGVSARPRGLCRLISRAPALSSMATTEDLRRYLARSPSADCARSVARRLSAIRQLYRFLYAEGSAGTTPPPCSKARGARRPLPKCSQHRRGRPAAGVSRAWREDRRQR